MHMQNKREQCLVGEILDSHSDLNLSSRPLFIGTMATHGKVIGKMITINLEWDKTTD